MIACILLQVLSYFKITHIASISSGNSEAFASDFSENIEGMFPVYILRSSFRSSVY